LKSGDTDKLGTFCFWYKSVASHNGDKILFSRWNTNDMTFAVDHFNDRLDVGWATSPTSANWDWVNIMTFVEGRNYHFGVVVDGVNKTVRIRIWDDTALTATTYTHSYVAELYLGTADFRIGASMTGGYAHANFDEFVAFNRSLSDDEIDKVRQGIFN
jgi:hypothetical protein